MAKQYKVIEEYISDLSLHDLLDGKSFNEVREYLFDLEQEYFPRAQALHGDRVIDIRMVVEAYGYDGGVDVKVIARRYETDKERNSRLAKDKKKRERRAAAKAKKDEKERAEYERLKRKFE